MRQLIARELRRAHRKIQPGRVPLVIATSGTAAALSEAYAARRRTARSPSSGGNPHDQPVAARLAGMSRTGAHARGAQAGRKLAS